jgi:O-antigen/teichoic acid export membrane protein
VKSYSLVRRNITANFIGRAWAGLLNIILTPIYVRILGIENYGLIGIYASLLALLSFLDLGLSTTLNRQIATRSTKNDTESLGDLVYSMEITYWGIGIIIGATIACSSTVISERWLNLQSVDAVTANHAIRFMGLIALLEWPSALYSGGLMGMQRQVLFNGMRSILASIQSIGTLAVLLFWSPTIFAFFYCQAFFSFIQTILLGITLWSKIPAERSGSQFRISAMTESWKFTAGITGISIVAIVLTQCDKIILSKWLTLSMFGYYILAFNIANVLTYIVNPFFTALFPKFSQLATNNEHKELSSIYHNICQSVSIIVLPIAITLVFFSKEILSIWFRDPIIVNNIYPLVRLLSIGVMLNCLVTIPYCLQLAYGWTKLSFYKNLIAVTILIPMMYVMIDTYGAQGAAIVWIILNLSYCMFEIPVMHKRILKGEMWEWYWRDVGFPLVISVVFIFFSKCIMPEFTSYLFIFGWISITTALSLLITYFSMKIFANNMEA